MFHLSAFHYVFDVLMGFGEPKFNYTDVLDVLLVCLSVQPVEIIQKERHHRTQFNQLMKSV